MYSYNGPFNFSGTYVCYLYYMEDEKEDIGRTQGEDEQTVKDNAIMICEALNERIERLS